MYTDSRVELVQSVNGIIQKRRRQTTLAWSLPSHRGRRLEYHGKCFKWRKKTQRCKDMVEKKEKRGNRLGLSPYTTIDEDKLAPLLDAYKSQIFVIQFESSSRYFLILPKIFGESIFDMETLAWGKMSFTDSSRSHKCLLEAELFVSTSCSQRSILTAASKLTHLNSWNLSFALLRRGIRAKCHWQRVSRDS